MNLVRIYIIFLLFGLGTGVSLGQKKWQGRYHAKRLLIEKSQMANDRDSFFLSSPEYYYKRIPLQQNYLYDSLILKNREFNLEFIIKSDLDSSFTALFTNHEEINLVKFRQVSNLQPHSYPQHPKGDLPYVSTELVFKGKKTGIDYGGTLVIPNGKEKYPLALLLNGTGQQDRNYTYSGHQFFTVLADALARKGIASFRVDDRGIGKTTGNFKTSAISDFTNDAREALEYLKNRKDIDSRFMGLIGHSEGGVVASRLTAVDKDVRFMVSLSGVGVSGLEILDLQNTAILKTSKMPDSLVNLHMALYRELFSIVYHNQKPYSLKAELENSVKNWIKDKSPETLKALQLADGRDQTLIYRFYKSAKTKAYKEMILYDPRQYLYKIEVPVLILNGDTDIFVPAYENVASFKENLVNAPVVTTKIYPGLNHMYQHCKTCTSREISTLDEVFAPEVLQDIENWILKQFKSKEIDN
ncbi:alpha/beta hydrolase family protein [Zunongwangia sp.]|uniref:alpha/beta hydrolase family protein n=1 Tax=Zunongwangia sp. TaxID=1965325 RepID=UPI003AA8DBC5